MSAEGVDLDYVLHCFAPSDPPDPTEMSFYVEVQKVCS